MPALSPRTAVTTFAFGVVVLAVDGGGGVGTLVGALGSAIEPIHGTGPSDAAGSKNTSEADDFPPPPHATSSVHTASTAPPIASRTRSAGRLISVAPSPGRSVGPQRGP